MNIDKRKAISTSATVAIIVVILVIAGVAAYFVLTPAPASSTTTTTTQQTTTTTTQQTTTTTTQHTTTTTTTTTTAPSVAYTVADCVALISGTPSSNTTITYTGTNYNAPATPTPPTTGAGQYGPKNSSQLIDESTGAAPDALDPGYAFYSQDTPLINAVYDNLVEFNLSSGSELVPVLASSYSIDNGGCTNQFTLRSGLTFSNGDAVTAYDEWFSIVRTNYMNGPSGISTSNWNLVSYNNTAGCAFSTGCYGYHQGLQLPWGLRVAIQSATGLQTAADTPAAVNLTERVLNQMLSNFNPSNATQDAIMSYPQQAFVASATVFTANYLRSLGPLGPQLWAGFDGQQIVDPAFVDAHGGVQANTLNSYYDSNGGPGTGPYEIVSVGPSMAPIVLDANTHYWALGASGVPEVAEPASISTIVVNPWSTDSQAIEDFTTNVAGLSVEAAPNFNSMYGGLPSNVKAHYSFAQIYQGIGKYDFSFWLSYNENTFPTNNTAFKQGMSAALNYTALNQVNLFNGTYYASMYAGPVGENYAPYYLGCDASPLSQYTTASTCFPVPTTNTTAAWNFFNEFGLQTKTYMVVPSQFTLSNGTVIKAGTTLGDTSGSQLQPIKVYYAVPLTGALETTLTIFETSVSPFGITLVPYGTTTAEFDLLDGNPATYPTIQYIGWGSDFNDPFFTQLYPTIGYPSPYNGFFNYGPNSGVANVTLASDMTACAFPATAAQVSSCINFFYQVAVDNAIFSYVPIPIPNYFFIQPYVQGMNDNQFVGVFYNLLYYSPVNV
jgi:peptide/nickel transport system substrate-binding protein